MRRAFTVEYGGPVTNLRTECRVNPAVTDVRVPEVLDMVALWDTGAAMSSISPQVVDLLDLKTTEEIIMNHAGGVSRVGVYRVDILLPGGIEAKGVRVTVSDLIRFDVLIGMDIIGMGNLAVCNSAGMTTLTFRVPARSPSISFVPRPRRSLIQ
jgi:hypothetical protein